MNLDTPRQTSYKPFPGRNIEQMPALIGEGRTPMTMFELAKRRIEILEIYNAVQRKPQNFPDEYRQRVEEVYHNLWDNYFDTGDLWLRQSVKQVENGKVVLYNPQVHEFLKTKLNPKVKIEKGALVLGDEYASFTGSDVLEFNKAYMGKHFGKSLSKQEAKESAFWRFVLGDLSGEYMDAVFSQAQQRFKYDKNMGIYVADAGDDPAARLWFVSGYGGGSDAYGNAILDVGGGRLVGVAPEARVAQKASAQTLEQRV